MNYYDEEIEINKETTKNPTENQIIDNIVPNLRMSAKLPKTTATKTVVDDKNIKTRKHLTDSSESDSDPSKSEEENRILTANKWANLPVPEEIKDLLQNLLKYVPQNIDVEYHLYPFIPDFVPAVGDVDAFLKVTCPEAINVTKSTMIIDHVKKMGLSILDEPSGNQSEPSLLSMKLRSMLTNPGTVISEIPIAKNIKDIDNWIHEMEEIHIGQSFKTSSIGSLESQLNLDIDNLMCEWPKSMEITLNRIGFPICDIDCSLENYIKIVCNMFDIPVTGENPSYFLSIYALFSLYLAVIETLE